MSQIVQVQQRRPILVPRHVRHVLLLHHTMEERRFALHDRLVDGRNLNQRTTLDGQMEPGAIVAEAGRPIREHHTAFVPAGVRFADRRQIDGCRVVVRIVVRDEIDSADEEIFGGEYGIVKGERLKALEGKQHY